MNDTDAGDFLLRWADKPISANTLNYICVMTAREAFTDLSKNLTTIYDRREAGNIADWVIENLTGKKRWERRMDNSPLSMDELDLFDRYKHELLTGKPVQYVLNEVYFCGFRFILNNNVLIPRPETEELVHLIVSENQNRKNLSILDIGTGSGCISVSLKKLLSSALVQSIDVSDNAIDTAAENAGILNAEIVFRTLDFLNENNWSKLGEYDIIVSNPPYIPMSEKKSLSKNVVDFEPGIALFVPEDEPLLFYKKIEQFARRHLTSIGKIYMETHEVHATEVLRLFNTNDWQGRTEKDMYGKNRMVVVSGNRGGWYCT